MDTGMDWNEIWKKDFGNASWRKNKGSLVDMWNKRARAYNEGVHSRRKQTEQIINKLDIRTEDTVIDIGSGPGTLTIPLAEICSDITAVDPSVEMLDCIREKAEKNKYNNISYVNKRWEDAISGEDITKSDVVIACHCLIMEEMRDALKKMNDHASRQVYLFRFAGRSDWYLEDIWLRLYDEPYQPNPDYIYIVNILHQLEIYADVEILSQQTKRTYSCYDEAVDELMDYLPGPSRDAREIILDYMKSKLKPYNGVLCREHESKVAMISWKKK